MMPKKPKTKYAKSGNINIAYQVLGEGPIDIVYIPGWVSNLDMMWTETRLATFLTKLSSFSRLILFDKRGTGLSDRMNKYSTLEERMDDIRAVMDAVGSESAALFGHSEGGSVSMLFAATYPERTIALVTFGVFAKRKYSKDYPWAPTDAKRQLSYKMVEDKWADGDMQGLKSLVPSLADDDIFMDWFASYLRSGASPGAALELLRLNTDVDIIGILSSIRVPTLLLHRTGDIDVHVDEAKFIAERISNSKFVELQGDDHLFWAGNSYSILAEIEEFITGVRPNKVFDRVLSTILFTDIVRSTEHLSKSGDKKWMNILEKHNALVREELRRFNGKEIKNTGDGFLATFDGPSRAVRCAQAIRDGIKKLGIEITVGIHTGECEIFDAGDIGGIAVHIAARVLSKAQPNQILISMTVKHLLSSNEFQLTDLGNVSLKGIEDDFRIYALEEQKITSNIN
ncbi:MAG: adenylate/guanylate cyclase domain-containing protein [Winogradskyella sp.]|uniref:adenylate/guanylate cyclase domain-containing protein n=1 Tax=Winogradskyella sp. TaxID=1883156 RepID=UPI0017D65B62|nr:adenylate/guanylate cyclase domain-containing protein [Winogradskyella sp.]